MGAFRVHKLLLACVISSTAVLSMLAVVTGVKSANKPAISSTDFLVVTATVGVWPQHVGVNPNTGYVYVGNTNSADVTILKDTAVITTLTVGAQPYGIGVNPNTGYAYVSIDPNNSVAVLSGTQVVTWVTGFAYPRMIAVNPSNGYVYVGSNYFNSVYVLSATQMITTVSLGSFGASNHAYDIQVNPLSGRVYIPIFDTPAGNLLKILSGTQIIATIPISYAGRVGINPNTGYVYLTNANLGTVSVISGTTIVDELPVGSGPRAIAVDPLRNYIYVANRNDDTVSVISGTAVVGTVPVSDTPSAIGIEPGTGFAYVAHGALEGSVIVLSGTQRLATLRSGLGGHAVVANPATRIVYVADGFSTSVTTIQYVLPLKVYLPLIGKNH